MASHAVGLERARNVSRAHDATTAPYVHKYQSVGKFLEPPYQETRDVDIATITGVGSSALGSAALAWDISVALEKPVLAIVPGYGVADVVLQGLGGWFAFGLHDFLSSKTLIQTGLATAAPSAADAVSALEADPSWTLLPRRRPAVTSNLTICLPSKRQCPIVLAIRKRFRERRGDAANGLAQGAHARANS